MSPGSTHLYRLRRIESAMRVVDIVLSLGGLLLLMVPMILIGLLVRGTSKGPALFRHRRVGRHGKTFDVLKFRTMVQGAESMGPSITSAGDSRTTPLGSFLRRSKLDELPQLWNILKGEMSFVGPRPEVPSIVEAFSNDYSILTLVRPGLTSEVTLRFRDEESMLPEEDTERHYREVVLPEKIEGERKWIERRQLGSDLEILFRTLLALTGLRSGQTPIRWHVGRKRRLLFKAAIDFSIALFAWYLANFLRFEGFPSGEDWTRMHGMAIPLAALTVLSLHLGGIVSGIWRLFSIRDVCQIALLGVPLAALLTGLRAFLPDSLSVLRTPYSVIAMTYSFSVVLQCGIRLLRTGMVSWTENPVKPMSELKGRVVFYGAGRSGRRVLAQMRRVSGRTVCPLAFFDDDVTKKATRLNGVPVLGTFEDLPSYLEDTRPDLLIIAIHHLPEARLRSLVTHADWLGVRVKIVPALMEQIDPRDSQSFRDVRIDDLIGRPPVRLDPRDPEVRAAYTDRVVMVTGAGGSIGSELVRHLHSLNPKRLILVDKDENSLFRVDRELRSSSTAIERTLLIRDIRRWHDMADVFRKERPDVVIHAAAHKHVPLMEANPIEAISNNVLGTWRLARLASAAGIDAFVFISTDKAVRPSSVMGATKRAGELLIRSLGERSSTRFSVVRFGNVLGSQGSVVETFREQLRRGESLTITHEEMERYFLSLPEAVQLVLIAGSLQRPRGSYVLEMGEPRRIIDLARDMIRLYAADRERPVTIEVTGLRPGEKMSEELFVSGNPKRLRNREGILLDEEAGPPPRELDVLIEGFQNAVRSRSEAEAFQWLSSPWIGLKSPQEASSSSMAS